MTARLTTFLYPVVKHLPLTAAARQDGGGSGSAGDDGRSEEPSPQQGLEDLRVVLSAVPEIHREVLLMRYVDDMSLEEIAHALSIPLGTVKSRIHNALKMLSEDERTRRFFQ